MPRCPKCPGSSADGVELERADDRNKKAEPKGVWSNNGVGLSDRAWHVTAMALSILGDLHGSFHIFSP